MGRNSTFITDTVIITSKTQNVCSQPIFNEIVEHIQTYIVNVNEINDSNPLEIASLPGFRRIVVISPSHRISVQVRALARDMPDYTFGFSMTDHHTNCTGSTHLRNSSLKVPETNRVFLVSPPASPPSDFDYSRLEETPNSSSLHTLEPSNNCAGNPCTLLDNGQVQITLNPSQTQGTSTKSVTTIKTSMPSSSTFDDIID